MRILPLDEIARGLAADPAGFVSRADADYEAVLTRLARDIYENREEHPLILLSGPSGSGKTTTALKLEQRLDAWGCETHTLSMDNYFHPFDEEQQRRVAAGEIDLESPARVDAELLSAQLADIIACRPVSLPRYDFATSQRVYSGPVLRRRPGDLVIVEGIHALNPAVARIPDARSARLYVSVRTRLSGGSELLHPAKIRLCRRMIRDRLYRSRGVRETLRLFASVERGEALYIMPHKKRATHEVDTFCPYELAAYRPLLEADLKSLAEAERAPVADLMRALSALPPLAESFVPREAMIREFLGNGQFDY